MRFKVHQEYFNITLKQLKGPLSILQKIKSEYEDYIKDLENQLLLQTHIIKQTSPLGHISLQ